MPKKTDYSPFGNKVLESFSNGTAGTTWQQLLHADGPAHALPFGPVGSCAILNGSPSILTPHMCFLLLHPSAPLAVPALRTAAQHTQLTAPLPLPPASILLLPGQAAAASSLQQAQE
jgi:hypothetical protein